MMQFTHIAIRFIHDFSFNIDFSFQYYIKIVNNLLHELKIITSLIMNLIIHFTHGAIVLAALAWWFEI